MSPRRPASGALWSPTMKPFGLLPLPIFVVIALHGAVAAPAQPGFGEWAEGERARARLISAGIGEDGTIAAGVEIMLEPGWWTYWRTPGTAGIPPVIDLSGSKNLGPITVSYPLPQRHDNGYGASNIYMDGVLLPIDASVPEPGAPVDLHLSLDIGVCEQVCIPEHLEATLTVMPGAKDRIAAATLAGARAQVPGPPVAGMLTVDSARRSGGTDKHPSFDVAVTAPEGAEVFIEGPPDWFPGVPERIKGGDDAVYRVIFDRLGAKTPIESASLRVTLAADGKAVEQVVTLD
jgi:DsbC/DsbD-like thiol-disulfide interchange protein